MTVLISGAQNFRVMFEEMEQDKGKSPKRPFTFTNPALLRDNFSGISIGETDITFWTF
jgi:hypothetical protein